MGRVGPITSHQGGGTIFIKTSHLLKGLPLKISHRNNKYLAAYFKYVLVAKNA